MENLIREFCDKRKLGRKHPSLRVGQNEVTKREFVHIDDLMIIVRFLGYMKFENNRKNNRNHIFMRGQTDDSENMLPSIFRNADSNRILRRLEAYKKINKEIYRSFDEPPARFKGEIGGASSQHYGLKTPWLDLVDNIFIALWFARNEMNWIGDNSCKIEKSKKEFGWIYLVKADYEQKVNDEGICTGEKTQWCDLRYHHRDLSLRPHFQHGIFISKSNYSESNFDLNDEVVATIRFPITKLDNDIKDATPKHIFPDKSYDNTYKYLTKPRINKLINRIEKEFDLNDGEMGRIFTVN